MAASERIQDGRALASMNESGSGERVTIAHLLEANEKAIQVLREEVGLLIDRIAPVLMPESPESDSKLASPDIPEHSEVGRILQDHTAMLYRVVGHINDTRARVEL